MTQHRRNFMICLLLNLLLSLTSEAILLPALFLLLQRQQQNSAPSQQSNSQPTTASVYWTTWEAWTMCSSSTAPGVRVRSRGCNVPTCIGLQGNNYETQTCNLNNGEQRVERKTEFMNMCTNDSSMNTTMSCKLYMESPDMAYNIYQSTGCMFTMLDESNMQNQHDNIAIG
uniref:Uncharacterized protein n=1 Tax=Ciona savignyi TaxID=51511 RepID=H2ZPJ8_CIOSA